MVASKRLAALESASTGDHEPAGCPAAMCDRCDL